MNDKPITIQETISVDFEDNDPEIRELEMEMAAWQQVSDEAWAMIDEFEKEEEEAKQ